MKADFGLHAAAQISAGRQARARSNSSPGEPAAVRRATEVRGQQSRLACPDGPAAGGGGEGDVGGEGGTEEVERAAQMGRRLVHGLEERGAALQRLAAERSAVRGPSIIIDHHIPPPD
jgi:hypothetical protein